MTGFADFEGYAALRFADLVRRVLVTPRELLDAAIEWVEVRNPFKDRLWAPGVPEHEQRPSWAPPGRALRTADGYGLGYPISVNAE